jgi:hypothetical protein
MKSELKEFLAEGLKHYKQASHVMTEFFRNTQVELQEILKKRKDWGSAFKPKETIKVKSTKYWDNYPFINAFIAGTIEGEAAQIGIALNWFQSEAEYPFYEAWLDDGPESICKNIGAYKKKGRFELSEKNLGLKMNTDPNDFNMERDFNILIDEFVRILSQ